VRYFCTAIIQWEVDLPIEMDSLKTAAERLTQFLPADITYRQLRTKCSTTTQKKVVLGFFTPEEVFSNIGEGRATFKCGNYDYQVNMNSHRYSVFNKNRNCAACGIEGKYFLLEGNQKDKRPHFNFYAEENGKYILMTKDHVLARANGGQDEHSNYQTMCSVCNNLKSNFNMTSAQVAELRSFYNVVHKKLSRKQLAENIKEKRVEILNTTKF
jgi:hypothetical protein